ncbi:acyl carrier protein [Nonomuraea roseoviolacea]|uniref:Acyl carrier protein n=1 Tax=Nonomuraea roseoviolacea subsp. carminata TaxID=160689 RepID=A0ABT1KB65_9ACTN|nr:acyl carrier protein [Nonomuraea roseoviolacea]MCP2351253.1 acyl carrier protein [Nonomuraea roseoviolacea subsp. carminata]
MPARAVHGDERTPVERRLRELLARRSVLPGVIESVDAGADLWELGMESLAMVGVMVAVEDEFGVEFPDELLTRDTFRSLAVITDAVVSLTREEGPA